MIEKIVVATSTLLLLVFFSYKLYSKKNYLILLPIFYTFVSLWVAIGLADDTLKNSIWYFKESDIVTTHFVFLGAAISFYLGSTCISRKDKLVIFNIEKLRNSFRLITNNQIVTLYLVSIILLHFAFPAELLYFRGSYGEIYDGRNGLKMLFSLLVNITALILPFHKSKLARNILLIILLIFLQGLNKREILLVPILYFFGSYIRDLKINYINLLVASFLALFFASTAYSFRHNSEQGIISNIVYFFNNGIDAETTFDGINYIFGYSFLATLATNTVFKVTFSEFLISINPLPSFLIDITPVLDNHKLTVFAPYSALGTLASLGFAYVCIYYFLCGFFFNFCKSHFPSRFSIASPLLLLFFMMFTVLSVQYQLRTVTRFIYYAVIYFAILKTVAILISNLNRRG